MVPRRSERYRLGPSRWSNREASRVVVVTGGASGIGRALAVAMASRGDRVVAVDLDDGALGRAVDAMNRDLPGELSGVEADVRDPTAMANAIEGVMRAHSRLDVLVNNAGVLIGGPAEELTIGHCDRMIDVNLRGVIHATHAAYPIMIAQRSGHIVNVASAAGLLPAPLGAAYAATKHAVVGLSLSLRAEAGAHGVRVSVVCPGLIDTPMLDSAGPADLPTVPLQRRKYLAYLAGRAGRHPYPPAEVAADVLRGLHRNQPIIFTPPGVRRLWRIQRLAPGLIERHAMRTAAWGRAHAMTANGQ
jgi:NAD(P)-dependent dehydrogenase (short-subunit alcohol dehydrogenase family)